MRKRVVLFFATGFGLGLSPFASGTAGTLLGVVIVVAMSGLGQLWQAVLAVVLLIAVSLVKYRTIRPCEMLKKERIERIREGIESAGEDAREAVADHSERAEQILDDVSEALGGLADGLAERVAEAEVDEMSTRQCIAELWNMRKDN